MLYLIRNELINKSNKTNAKMMINSVFKIVFIFSYFFERKRLNKIMTIKNKPMNVFIIEKSPVKTSKAIKQIIIKTNKIFNIIEKCLIIIVTTFYRKEEKYAR